jgi:hypothetical protein
VKIDQWRADPNALRCFISTDSTGVATLLTDSS